MSKNIVSKTFICIYCDVSCSSNLALREHCKTENHELMVMSDSGRDWKHRPPPRGFEPLQYILCYSWETKQSCSYGSSCVEAHGEQELIEWKERFTYRKLKLNIAQKKKLSGKTYCEKIHENLLKSKNPNSLMRENIENVDICVAEPLTITLLSKKGDCQWEFKIKSEKKLHAVVLLDDAFKNNFSISSVSVDGTNQAIENSYEWILSSQKKHANYRIIVKFNTDIYGTFRQTVAFDFKAETYLIKKICVDVVPDNEKNRFEELRKEITKTSADRWTSDNYQIVRYPKDEQDKWEDNLIAMYRLPGNLLLSLETMQSKGFTKNNYRNRMHELLFVEEIARNEIISGLKLDSVVQVAHSYILTPDNVVASTTKHSAVGELFGVVTILKTLSEDFLEGKLILMHCQSLYLMVLDDKNTSNEKTIYELPINDRTKNKIYFKFSTKAVNDLNLKSGGQIKAQIQFQLNRLPYCQWHYAIDKLPNTDILFPEVFYNPQIPWSPERQWNKSLDMRLNIKQKEAIVAATTQLEVPLPPILVIGPYGTGKTFVLAQIVRELIFEPQYKILLCTHSNSAADLYIREYFDSWRQSGITEINPLRIYYEKRWVETVSPTVQKYCLINTLENGRAFRMPTIEDIMKHNVIVVTLGTSVHLSSLNIPDHCFTHILIDEAAQALECETVMPLVLANRLTRIVIAGDHMQMGPDVFSTFSKEKRLDESLLERLYYYYPGQFSCKIMLCENYRSHESIINFTSSCFYEQKLFSKTKQPQHNTYYPLTFFTTRGEDIQDINSTAFYNNSEVYEVVERVNELRSEWPSEEWGEFNDRSIGVVTPYMDQVFRIRLELRKKRINEVCVERVQNIQGKQFRVIILSTVRTKKTVNQSEKDVDYGFLSNSKLLNTAITRAQSLIAVIGDPVALCSVGRCSKIWEKFIQTSADNKSLYGITWNQINLQLHAIELKKTFKLNPLAPEFVPRWKQNQHNGNYFPPGSYGGPPIGYFQPLVPPIMPQPFPLPFYFPIAQPPPMYVNGVRPLINAPDSRLIQFKTNVHFPQTSFTEYLNLLPKNMSLADMLATSSSVQEKWYHCLKQSMGEEAAEKFKYLIDATKKKGTGSVNESLVDFDPISNASLNLNSFNDPPEQLNIDKSVYMQEHSNGFNESNPETIQIKNENDLTRKVNEEFGNLELCDNGLSELSFVRNQSQFSKYFSHNS